MKKVNLDKLNVKQLSHCEAKKVEGGGFSGRFIGWVAGAFGAAYTPTEAWMYGYGPRY